MKSTRSLNAFDFPAFVQHMFGFYRTVISEDDKPTTILQVLDRDSCHPDWLPEDDPPSPESLLQQGFKVYFPFTDTGVLPVITCADGRKRRSGNNTPRLGEIDTAGFVITLDGDQLTFETAISAGGLCCGPMPSIDLDDCGSFGAVMLKLLDRFQKTPKQPRARKEHKHG